MDINFHYFTIRTLAFEAQFSPQDSDIIAFYSQFIDDYNEFDSMRLDNVPLWAQRLQYKGKFHPTTTGFNTIDSIRLLKDENQQNIVAPFHFIPSMSYKHLKGYEDYRTKPAKMAIPSLISNMLLQAKLSNSDKRLMLTGMLLHTFADTYAHQGFSGFKGWENDSILVEVVNAYNPTENLTRSYSPTFSYMLPSLGHGNVSHAPDDTFARVEWIQRYSRYDIGYPKTVLRANCDVFSEAAREILDFMCDFRGIARVTNGGWVAINNRLNRGFNTKEKKFKALKAHWQSIPEYQNIDYNYDNKLDRWLQVVAPNDQIKDLSVEDILYHPDLVEAQGIRLEDIIMISKSDDFYYYNIFADNIRQVVHGDRLTSSVDQV